MYCRVSKRWYLIQSVWSSFQLSVKKIKTSVIMVTSLKTRWTLSELKVETGKNKTAWSKDAGLFGGRGGG